MHIAQLMLMIYTWFSTLVYAFLIYKLLRARQSTAMYRSSYYLLFILQFGADLYVIFVIEIILLPMKFNYFGLFSQDMQWYATFSIGNVVAAKTVIGCGHIIIALNRFTAFYAPLKQEQVSRQMYGKLLWLRCTRTLRSARAVPCVPTR